MFYSRSSAVGGPCGPRPFRARPARDAALSFALCALLSSPAAKAQPVTDLVPSGANIIQTTSTPGVTVGPPYHDVPVGSGSPLIVELKSLPTHDVTITIGRSGDAALTVDTDRSTPGDQSTLTLTATKLGRTAWIKAADDRDAVGRMATFSFSARSEDTSYNEIDIASVTATVVEHLPVPPPDEDDDDEDDDDEDRRRRR